jgi:hypothetical protein
MADLTCDGSVLRCGAVFFVRLGRWFGGRGSFRVGRGELVWFVSGFGWFVFDGGSLRFRKLDDSRR